MPVNKIYQAPLDPEKFYHICNRTNNHELLFRSDENRRFFLQQAEFYLSIILDIHAYCLLSNHFHFQVKMKSEEFVTGQILMIPKPLRTKSQKLFLKGKRSFSHLASKTFTRFFISYTISFNNKQNRQGNLFYKNFKRIEIENDEQYRNTMVYIHTNPVKHGIVDDFSTYKWSSWGEYTKKRHSTINREFVYEIFGSKKQFIEAHYTHQDYLIGRIPFPI